MTEHDPGANVTRRPTPQLAMTSAGLLLTLAGLAVLYVDRLNGNVLAAHIQDGYPEYSRSRVQDAATTYLVYLSAVGLIGVVGWVVTLRLVVRQRRSAPWVAAGLFVLGTGIALFDLMVRDTSGDTGLAPLLGWVGLLPSLAGLALVVMLIRSSLHLERH